MGIQERFTDCRTAQEGDGSVTMTTPRPLAEEWDIEHGEQLPSVTEGDQRWQRFVARKTPSNHLLLGS